MNALESNPVRLIVTKFLGKCNGIEGVVVHSVTTCRYLSLFFELSLKLNSASRFVVHLP